VKDVDVEARRLLRRALRAAEISLEFDALSALRILEDKHSTLIERSTRRAEAALETVRKALADTDSAVGGDK
jgi:hypothetical protein